MKTIIAIISSVVLHAAFFAITYIQNPSTDNFFVYYLSWVVVPAAFAAIAFAPRFHFVAAISNAIVATSLFDYLLVQHGYFWPHHAEQASGLAAAYLLIGVALAFIVAGYVHSIFERTKRYASIGKMGQTKLAIQHGFLCSAIFSLVVFGFCAMPPAVGAGVTPIPRFGFAAIVASCFLAFGTLIALAVGLFVDLEHVQTGKNGSAKNISTPRTTGPD